MASQALVKVPSRVVNEGGRLVFKPPRPTIAGIDNSNWFGPLQPIAPIAPAGTEPRGLQYATGQNLITVPRATEEVSPEDLREFARYPVVRYIIETRKDQICRQSWTVRLRALHGETNRQRVARELADKDTRRLNEFFAYPNPDCAWRDFLRMWMEDMLVIDAPALLMRKTRAGELGELRIIDGATIVRYIDENGWTPQGNAPAYAQLWYKMPMVELSTDQLVYRPSNPRSNKLYGYSKCEQALKHIELGSRRLDMQLQYYDNGSIPDGIMVVPPSATPEQIERQQEWMNSTLAGNLARRVQLRLIQGFNLDGKPEQLIFPKEKLLTDETDDLIIRSLCFAFQVSPQRWQKMVNRASAEASQEASEEEGLEPVKLYVGDTINYIIQKKMGFPNHEFTWQDHREPDCLKQAQADEIYVRTGINAINEIRQSKGDDPSPNPAADQLNIVTSQGMIEVGELVPQKTLGGEPGAEGTGDKKPPTRTSPKQNSPAPARKAADGHEYKYASTQINLPVSYAEEILELGKSLIPDEHLVGKGREIHAHITVRYGVHADEDKLRKILADQPPFDVFFGDVHVFSPSEASEGAAPVVIKVISAELRRLSADIGDVMAAKENDFEYTPHVTVAYIDPTYAALYQNAGTFGDMRLRVTKIALTDRDGGCSEYPLGMGKVAAGAAVATANSHPGPFVIDPHRLLPSSEKARGQLQEGLRIYLRKMADTVAARVASLGKADKRKSVESILDDDAFWTSIWSDLPAEITEQLEDAALAGLTKGTLETRIGITGLLSGLNETAHDYASRRAAEMVGMRYDPEGKLLPDTNAKRSISTSTRNDIRKIIARAFEKETSMPDLVREIREATSFDERRAALIARNEVVNAQVEGNLKALREAGVARTKAWFTSQLPGVCENCKMNEAAGTIPFEKAFPSGAMSPLEHIQCRCSMGVGV